MKKLQELLFGYSRKANCQQRQYYCKLSSLIAVQTEKNRMLMVNLVNVSFGSGQKNKNVAKINYLLY